MKKNKKLIKKLNWLLGLALLAGTAMLLSSPRLVLDKLSAVRGESVVSAESPETSVQEVATPTPDVPDVTLPPVPTSPAPQASTPAPASKPKSTASPSATSKTAVPAATQPATPPPVTPSGSDIAPESVCPGQSSLAATTTVLVCMTSYARTQLGLTSIAANASLMDAAAAKAQDMVNCGYSHTACDRSFDYWIPLKGYTGKCSAENIAKGQKTPLAVFTAWMNSAGHRANILNPTYKHIGVATIAMTGGPGWVMLLGGC